MIYYVKCDPILQVSNQEPSTYSKPPQLRLSQPNHVWSSLNLTKTPPHPPDPTREYFFSDNSYLISSNFQDIFLTIYQHHLSSNVTPSLKYPVRKPSLNIIQAPNLFFHIPLNTHHLLRMLPFVDKPPRWKHLQIKHSKMHFSIFFFFQ